MPLSLTLFFTISIFSGLYNGTASLLSTALLDGAGKGISLAVSLAGPLCLWCGVSHVMEQTRLMEKLSVFLSFVLKQLFPNAWKDKEARQALCGNFSANLLGLGSAATPLGIRAACRMAQTSGGIASDELCKLIVMNTASIQLIPTTVAALRASLGASSAFDILPAVWITSVCSVAAGLICAKGLKKWC